MNKSNVANMKIQKDTDFYCIKADQYMWAEDKGDYTSPVYVAIDTKIKKKGGKPLNLIILETSITDKLRIFATEKEANEWIKKHPACFTISCENERVVKIKYNFTDKEWEEM